MVLTAPAMEEKLGEQFPEAGRRANVAQWLKEEKAWFWFGRWWLFFCPLVSLLGWRGCRRREEMGRRGFFLQAEVRGTQGGGVIASECLIEFRAD